MTKGRFNSGNSSTTTHSTDTNPSNVDIFENVFSYNDDCAARSTCGESSSDLASCSASVLDLEINEFFMPQLDAASVTSGNGNGTGNISLSLRNSLLRLRHTRRHLAKLIESKRPTSGSSSASSSLTNSSATPLATQFTKQMTISALAR